MTVTISDIANESGVSVTTVSRVLNNSGYVSGKTRKRVLKVIKDLNYTPNGIARSLSKQETNTVGIVIPDITNSYFGEIIKGISNVAEKNNLNIILFNTEDNIDKEIKSLKILKEQRIRGIIMTPAFGEGEINSGYLNLLENPGVPLVLAAASVKYAKLNGVFVDNIKGSFDAVNHFIKAGHTKIGIITGNLNSEPAMDRLTGYKKALVCSDIPVKEEYIFDGNYKMNLAYRLTKSIFEMEERPTALLVSSNMMTIGCIKAVLDLGKKIPDDLAIIGFDRMEIFDLLGFNISFVDDSPEDLGKRSMEMLLNVIENQENQEIREITICPKVILKGSERFVT